MIAFSIPFFSVLVLLGIAVGIPASMCGLGGGFILVPTLILVFNLAPQYAIAISLVAMCGTTISATFGYIKQQRVDYKLAILYDVFDIPGVIAGAYLTTILPQNILVGTCGLFILVLSVLMLRDIRTKKEPKISCVKEIKPEDGWSRKVNDCMNNVFEYNIRKPTFIVISSLLSGLVTGLAGLGGGITDTTTMMLLGVPAHIAVASSEFAMALTNGAGVLTHGFLQNIPFDYALPVTIGTIIGAQIGVMFAKRTKQKTLKIILTLIAMFFSVRLILDVIFG